MSEAEATVSENKTPHLFSLWKRMRMCLVMLALESFISFEEIYMVAVLQRVGVTQALVSLPGTISSAIGIFFIPYLGWASDRYQCCPRVGQKRTFAMFTLCIIFIGMLLMLAVTATTLYSSSGYFNSSSFLNSSANSSVLESSQSNISMTGAFATALSIMGIAGFTLSDNGYDSSMSTFRAYALTVSHPSQHASLLITMTFMGAVGGCTTSALSYVDLTPILPVSSGVWDKGIAQCLIQSAILLILLAVLGTISLFTGSEPSLEKQRLYEEIIEKENPEQDRNENNSKFYSQEKEKTTSFSENYNGNLTKSNENIKLLTTPKKSANEVDCRGHRFILRFMKKHKQIIMICLMTFLGLCANYSYFVYVANFVAQVMYHGDPKGRSGSEDYANYLTGVRISSLGMLIFYCLYVVFNLCHDRILKYIRLKTEYIVANVLCGILMVTLAFSKNLVVFFVNTASLAMFRSVVYTAPFILVNNYSQRMSAENQNTGKSSGSSDSGSAISFVSAMIPASWLTVSILMGPLLEVTGDPTTPIYISAGCCFVALIMVLLVKFD